MIPAVGVLQRLAKALQRAGDGAAGVDDENALARARTRRGQAHHSEPVKEPEQ